MDSNYYFTSSRLDSLTGRSDLCNYSNRGSGLYEYALDARKACASQNAELIRAYIALSAQEFNLFLDIESSPSRLDCRCDYGCKYCLPLTEVEIEIVLRAGSA